MALPALRNLDATPVEHNGDTLIVLRDQEGIVDEQIALSRVAFFVASLLDGANDVADIQYLFCSRSGGRILPAEEITKIVEYLDEHGFLQSKRFDEIKSRVEADFAARETREAELAGGAYPDAPEEARSFLDAFFLHGEGPGACPAQSPGNDTPVRCLIAPHIDFERGGPAYAHGYLRLSRGRPPKTVLLYGVAHASPPVPFILTRKHFETPFGIVQTDRGLADRVAASLSYDPFQYEIVHRREHSIEFQAVMLAYLYGSAVRIVPVLCGMFPGDTSQDELPRAEDVARFLDVCREVVAESDGDVAVIAGADLAHVGLRFGDDFEIDEPVIERVQARDKEDLACVTSLDAEAWHRSVMKDQNARRVCGLNCIYSAMKSVDGAASKGECLHYGYAHDPAGGIVSFSSIVLT